jgi:hypothetical protein
MQVAYCDVIEHDDFSFRIVNPQKEVVLIGVSAADKNRWVQEINEAIQAARSSRCSMIGNVIRSMQLNS